MLAKVKSATVVGLNGVEITVEVDVAKRGLPSCTIVGLPGKEVSESKERVRTALVNSGYRYPDSRLTINLAPADIPKSGSSFDLPIAIGILAAQGIIATETLNDILVLGELSLEGEVKKVPGVLALTQMAKNLGKTALFVPAHNAKEASFIFGIKVYAIHTLSELVLHLTKKRELSVYVNNEPFDFTPSYSFDFAQIHGQAQAKRAMEIAAAGGHNLHLKGVPGAGKTMLSRAMPSILPPLEYEEILEVSRIYSVSNLLGNMHVMKERPFRHPHHTISKVGLIGGGTNPSPGEISLAHRGVLFLDEFPEFERSSLESLRQPLEDGVVTVSRAAGTYMFPSRFLLLVASNPCPCGYLGHPTKQCSCTFSAIGKYQKKISGPILDRIDLHIDIAPVEYDELSTPKSNESSETIRQRVLLARRKQKERLMKLNKFTNSELTSPELLATTQISQDAQVFFKQAAARFELSARGYFKAMAVAQTIADLAGLEIIEKNHIAESMQYRLKLR